jgi:hypothetical protein
LVEANLFGKKRHVKEVVPATPMITPVVEESLAPLDDTIIPTTKTRKVSSKRNGLQHS